MITGRSAELNELFAALSKVQGKVKIAKKDRAGYQNNYKFAELPQYIELSQELVEENGLSILQFPGEMEIIEIDQKEYSEVYRPDRSKEKTVSFHTIKVPKQSIDMWIGHTSGQYIAFKTEIIVEKLSGMSWGQSTGSAITYSRKHGRAGTLAMSQEDDDNQNMKQDNYNNAQRINRQEQRNLPKPEQTGENSNQIISIDQIKDIYLKCNNNEEMINRIKTWASIKEIKDLSVEQYNKAIIILESEKKQ